MVVLNEELKGKLNDLLNVIDMVVKDRRDSIKSSLIKVGVNEGHIESLLSQGRNLDELLNSLNDKQAKVFFKEIYEFSKNEGFNPVNAIPKKKRRSKYSGKELYNQSFKEEFLNRLNEDGTPRYSEDTKRVNRVLFGRASEFENKNGADLYNFTFEQLEEFIKSLKATTIRSLQNQISTVEQYTDFAIKHPKESTYVKSKINLAEELSSREKLEDYLDEEANMIFDRDELMDFAMRADNPQDGVIVGLLFDGVSQKNEHAEMINLTKYDCDLENHEIHIREIKDKEGNPLNIKRTVEISTETKILVEQALTENIYYSINQETARSRKYKLAESDHVLRGVRNNAKIKWENISHRLLRIANAWGLKNLNPTTISYSGQVYYADKALKDGKSIDDAITEVMDRFGIPNHTANYFYIKNRIEQYSKILKNK